jgi:hypothetical protein
MRGVIRLLIGASLLLGLSLLLLKGQDSTYDILIFSGLILYYLVYQLSSLELWGVTALLFDVRQGKRLFGVISAGDIPAKMLGYLFYLLFYIVLKKLTGDYSHYLP